MIVELYYKRILRVNLPKLFTRTRARTTVIGPAFGRRIRELRRVRKLTLEEVSKNGGLSRASISKIERGEMSPTYESLLKLARGLESDVGLLISARSAGRGEYDVTRSGRGARHRADRRFPSQLLAPAFSKRSLHAFVTEVRSVPLDAYGSWDRHDTEDFLYVLDGVIEVHLQDRATVRLCTGDSMQMDGRIPHALIAVAASPETAKSVAHLLWVSVPLR